MDQPDPGVALALRDLLACAHDVEASLARRLGLGTTDIAALQHLVAEPGSGTVDLATALRIRSASATVLVDRLQAAGHLRRTPHPTDRRRVVLALTDSARDEVIAALAPLLAAIDAVVAEYEPGERVAIERFLRQAVGALREFAATS